MQTKTLHVLSEFGRCPMHLTLAIATLVSIVARRQSMSQDRILKQACIADCRLPDKLSWRARLGTKLHDFLVSTPFRHRSPLPDVLLAVSQKCIIQLRSRQTSLAGPQHPETSRKGRPVSRTSARATIKHLRRSLARVSDGTTLACIETGRQKNRNR